MCSAYNKRSWFLKGFFFVLVFIAVLGLVSMLLWNWLMPAIFGLGAISYIQAIGLLLLSKILFSGIGKRGWHHGYRDHNWRAKFDEQHERFHGEAPKEQQ